MLAAGTRVGPYEIVSWLGAGGMGEVYRARDTKLHREVALKTLPDELAHQPDRLARLRQEARILAALNHPGIATLHGLEESGNGVPVLVMELVEGETLGERLRRGPLPLPQALKVAHETAVALEAAHEKGVLHRDLKPANVRLARDGRVKVLDFGLAKAVQEVGLGSQHVTQTSPSSGAAIVGTAPYMSPEQARGQEVDRRSDVWAFGCVLFEMLTGKRAFEGATFSDTVAAILDREPEWQALPGETPLAVRRVLRRCLQKEKDKRLRDIGDARLELEELQSGGASTAEVLREPRRPARWLTLALAVLLGGFASWVLRRPPSVRKDAVHLALATSAALPPQWTPLLSPAGDRIIDSTPAGLVVRDLDMPEGRLIPGTEEAFRPFFSPDGRWLGFEQGGSLKKVSLSGGVPVSLCTCVTKSFGATWGTDDTIVFTLGSESGLWQVPSSGGEPRELTRPDRSQGEKSHRWPHYLPGGKALLFTTTTSRMTTTDEARIEALRLPNGERRTVLEGGTAAASVESGHLVYRRGTSILAAPFDIDRLSVTADPVVAVDGVWSTEEGEPSFTVARTGMLAYVPHRKSAQRLVLVDRTGVARPLTEFVGKLQGPRVSPDGRVVAVTRPAANDQVWRFDIERGSFSRVTSEWDNGSPVWTPDGGSLIVASTSRGNLLRVRADGGSSPESLLAGTGSLRAPHSVTADGKLLAYSETGAKTGEDIWVVSLEHGGGGPRVFLQTPANESMPAISPSGRLIAYESDESGNVEVYLRSFPDGGRKAQVSAGGGLSPVWSRTGKELFYRVGLGGSKKRMMVADVTQENPIRVSRGRGLFEESYIGYSGSYDVFPDSQHFVMVEVDWDALRITHFNVVLNWFEELKRLVPPK